MYLLNTDHIELLTSVRELWASRSEENRLLGNQLLVNIFPDLKKVVPTPAQCGKVYTLRKRQNTINKFIKLMFEMGVAVDVNVYATAEFFFESNFVYEKKRLGEDAFIMYPSDGYLEKYLPVYHQVI